MIETNHITAAALITRLHCILSSILSSGTPEGDFSEECSFFQGFVYPHTESSYLSARSTGGLYLELDFKNGRIHYQDDYILMHKNSSAQFPVSQYSELSRLLFQSRYSEQSQDLSLYAEVFLFCSFFLKTDKDYTFSAPATSFLSYMERYCMDYMHEHGIPLFCRSATLPSLQKGFNLRYEFVTCPLSVRYGMPGYLYSTEPIEELFYILFGRIFDTGSMDEMSLFVHIVFYFFLREISVYHVCFSGEEKRRVKADFLYEREQMLRRRPDDYFLEMNQLEKAMQDYLAIHPRFRVPEMCVSVNSGARAVYGECLSAYKGKDYKKAARCMINAVFHDILFLDEKIRIPGRKEAYDYYYNGKFLDFSTYYDYYPITYIMLCYVEMTDTRFTEDLPAAFRTAHDRGGIAVFSEKDKYHPVLELLTSYSVHLADGKRDGEVIFASNNREAYLRLVESLPLLSEFIKEYFFWN